MSILINTGFKVGSAEPLDEYSIRETTADRDALVTNGYVYEGMEVYCKDTKIKYRWNGVAWDILDNTSVEDDDSTDNTVVFDKSIDTGKYFLLAKITDANYTNNILKFSCPNFKGQNQVGFRYDTDMDILKFELHFNTGSTNELNSYGVTLKQHGLCLYSYPLDNPKNTSPEIKDAVRLYWNYNTSEIYVFLVDLMTAIPHCCLEYTGSGTLLKENTFISDNMYNWLAGSSATWAESKWKTIPYNKLETPPIHELGGNGGSTEGTKIFTTLDELGLTAPVSVGDIFNAMPKKTMAMIACEGKEGNTEGSDVLVTDVPVSFGILTIKKNELGRFSIEYQNSLQGAICNVKRWIGTLKGIDGTELVWKQLSTEPTFVAINDIGLAANATFQDVIDKLPKGSSAILGVKEFTNYQTIFPYEEGNDQFARVHIIKGLDDGSCVYARWFRKDGVKEAIAKFNINDNKFNGWQRIDIGNTKKTLAFNSKTFKIDITKENENWNGNMKFGYCVDSSYGEIIISSIGTSRVTWSCSEGIRYVKSVTYTIDPDNKAHVTIGVELYDIVYGVHQLEMVGDFATINSFTGDAFTGTSVAVREGVRGRNHGVGVICDVADLGLTFPCTTVQIAQAMRNLSLTASRIPSHSMIGIFNCGSKAETITDAPSDYGLLHVETNGHDRILIRFDGISGSNYAGSWIGQIKGNNGTFSGITWCRIDNETRVTTLETQVSELFQSVSDGKSLVANAITGKGVSTATNATFATMATNIGKIPQTTTWKEETVSATPDSNSGIARFVFSNTVFGVRQITAPGYNYTAGIQETKMFTLNGNTVEVKLEKGSGTWKMTAMVRSS